MAYGRAYSRTRRGKKTPRTSNAKIRYKRPTASTQKHQILAINKKVNTLSKVVHGNTYKTMYVYNATGNLAQPFAIWPLVIPNTWTGVFNCAGEERGGAFRGINFKVDYRISSHTEPSPINCTVFFVSPKNQKVVNECGGAAADALTALVSGRDYTIYDGMALVNKKRWHIHHYSRITTLPISSDTPSGSTVIGDLKANRRSFSRKSNLMIRSRTGEWNTVNSWDLKPNQRMHMLVFNNNVNIDLESPQMNMKILFQGQTSG